MQPAAPTGAPMPPLGRRAKLAEDALNTASAKVISILTEERMAQCFPTYKDQYPDEMKDLHRIVVDRYNEGLPKAWEIAVRQWNFVDKANELDRIVADAEARRARGDPPPNLYLRGADPRITVPNATVPVVVSATEALRAKRIALEAKNQATFLEIQRNQHEFAKRKHQIQEILDDFQGAMRVLESIDANHQKELKDRLVNVLPMDSA